MLNRQPGKALEYYLRLRKPHVFDLIREHNLFTVVRDQVLLLMEFDQELEKRKKQEDGPAVQDIATPISPTYPVDKGKAKEKERSKAVALLVDHTYAIPVRGSLFILLRRAVNFIFVDCPCRPAASTTTLLSLPLS